MNEYESSPPLHPTPETTNAETMPPSRYTIDKLGAIVDTLARSGHQTLEEHFRYYSADFDLAKGRLLSVSSYYRPSESRANSYDIAITTANATNPELRSIQNYTVEGFDTDNPEVTKATDLHVEDSALVDGPPSDLVPVQAGSIAEAQSQQFNVGVHEDEYRKNVTDKELQEILAFLENVASSKASGNIAVMNVIHPPAP